MSEKLPEVSIEDGYTKIRAVVTGEMGFGTCRGMSRFMQECHNYQGNVFMKTPNNSEVDCKKFMQLIYESSPQGTELEFRVEGTDEKAARFARRLYSGATSEDICSMRFDRYEK